MSSVSYSDISHIVYSYLGYRNLSRDEKIDKLIIECLEEIEQISSFKYIYQEYDYILDFLKKKQYLEYLGDSTSYLICATTLGSQIDKRSKYYQMKDMVKMCVFDATASAYLEYMADMYEKSIRNDLSYRFCPGYQNTDVADIRPIHELLKAYKVIGITLLDSNLMVPQKSMIGIVGINCLAKKSCKNCFLLENCDYRKEGIRCYTIK
jgi:cobalamin-dependent methionine synthase I